MNKIGSVSIRQNDEKLSKRLASQIISNTLKGVVDTGMKKIRNDFTFYENNNKYDNCEMYKEYNKLNIHYRKGGKLMHTLINTNKYKFKFNDKQLIIYIKWRGKYKSVKNIKKENKSNYKMIFKNEKSYNRTKKILIKKSTKKTKRKI